MEHEAVAAVRTLLEAAESAHGEYETHELGGTRDAAWPRWYAVYLLDRGLGALLPTESTVEQLAAVLTQLDVEYRREQPSAPWPEYYAIRLVASQD